MRVDGGGVKERQRHGDCPRAGERIPLPYPVGTGIRIIDSPFTCAACRGTRRLEYPPLQIKSATLRARKGIRGGKGIHADALTKELMPSKPPGCGSRPPSPTCEQHPRRPTAGGAQRALREEELLASSPNLSSSRLAFHDGERCSRGSSWGTSRRVVRGAPEVGYTSTPSSETKLPSRSNASSTSSLSARGNSGVPTSNACEPHSLQSAMSGRNLTRSWGPSTAPVSVSMARPRSGPGASGARGPGASRQTYLGRLSVRSSLQFGVGRGRGQWRVARRRRHQRREAPGPTGRRSSIRTTRPSRASRRVRRPSAPTTTGSRARP